MQLEDWLNRLERLHFKAIDMGLERIRAVADRLDLINAAPFIFTVAGTNGKGSTVALIDQTLRQAGYRTGVYTSPHLVHFNERVCIHGKQCSDAELIAAFEAVEAGRGDTGLTYFEFTTLAAIWLFRQAGLDAWVLEVGLGGRLDAVNLWDTSLAVVTSIDIDHQAWLGSDRATIGMEKVGIARAGKPLVIGEPDLPEATLERARLSGAQLYRQGIDFRFNSNATDWTLELTTPAGSTTLTELPLPAIYLQNAATALQALLLSPFTITPDQIKAALIQVRVIGRRQLIARQPDVMLDVGHNPHAARALVQHIAARDYRRIHCVVGMLGDKDITETLLALLPIIDYWYPVELASERAASGDQIYNLLLELGACARPPMATANLACHKLLQNADKNDLILVFGSFYTVADVIQYSGLSI